MKLVTCGLPYANGKAHIGHLRTYIPADVYVKYLRLKGEDVIFVCGSDSHGTPIVVNAEQLGLKPKELVDMYHKHFIKIFKALDIEFDFYGRTDSEYHHKRTRDFVNKLIENGYIYPKEIELAYCENCERFLPDRYVEGFCPYCNTIARGDECDQGCGRHLEPGEILKPRCKICGNPAVFKKQKHYFFKLTEFKDFLESYLSNLNGTENALNYAREWVRKELKDWCITRNLEWGVKFPEDESLVVYVWVDAPIGYISFTEKACEKLEKDWRDIWMNSSEIIHFIGLDIVYHHCIFWPAMLKGSGFSLPTAIVASGMVKVEGKTFSKSRGYVVWVEEDYLKANFNTDYLRYYIINYTSHQKDLNFSWEVFKDKVNNELIATLGNFIYRVLHFAWKNFKKLRMEVDDEVISRIKIAKDKAEKAINSWEFKEMSDAFMELASFGNSYFQEFKPWELLKKDPKLAEKVVSSCLAIVRALAILAYPVLPKTMREVGKIIGLNLEKIKLDDVLSFPVEIEILKPKIPFERVEDEKIREMEEIMIKRISEASKGEVEEVKEGINVREVKEITIEDFSRLDIRIGKVVKAERIKGSKKLMKLEVDVGGEVRQIVAGIADNYSESELINRNVVVLTNIKPAKIMGVRSEGMILAADVEGKAILLTPDRDVNPGARVK